ncbi:CBF-domain-containing protein [Xylona heveae TC161]|uniref:CBF-domain-containing protein n=1 Tax=Xylona heveae (strain CBS 132557 / TC161) TaxID=1328760 RepID=A0A165JJH2_XYLHT|nr:CBF-domain-containing protein [Xylona heveae TC161]KZF26313.1 CBF-domain-containing protein [Xylona heveae TC161]
MPPSSSRSEKSRGKLVFDPRPDWHTTPLTSLSSDGISSAVPTALVEKLRSHGRTLLDRDAATFASSRSNSSSSNRFMSTIMSSGTLSDKISALTLAIQESPVHNISAFENLLNLARKRSRSQAITALGALKDLLGQGSVLPADRKLRPFNTQSGLLTALQKASPSWTPTQSLPGELTEKHLIFWVYEDWLKSAYFEVLKILEVWCNDEVEYSRSRALVYVWELLKEKPEQESNLLRLLVNKLGDPSRKISSKASFLLLQLQSTHPLMKEVIITSIESELLFRPGQNIHAKYYALITLNQTILSTKEENIANRLVDIYFSVFVALLNAMKKKEDEENSRGRSRFHRKPDNKALNAKKQESRNSDLSEQVNNPDEEMRDKVISAVLTGLNRSFPFSRLDDESNFKNHMETLFKITHSSNFNTSIQALMLIQQFSWSKQVSADRFYRTLYESILDPRLLTSSKQAMYLNLLYRSLKADTSVKRVKAFVKRLLQVVSLHQPPFICGVIYLVRELQSVFPSLKALLDQPEENGDADEERFFDAPDESGDENVESNSATTGYAVDRSQFYDGRKRDPEYSNADKTCLWELTPFTTHFHPSVSLFAVRLLQNNTMPEKPDLSLHTLSHFLDRFVYRNAKSNAGGPKGTSIMQPLAGGFTNEMLVSAKNSTAAQMPVNSENFWKKKTDDVAADEVFFHRYFNQVAKGKGLPSKRKRAEENNDDIEDEENEDDIWTALVNSRPELEGSEEGDSDLEMDDLQSDDQESQSDEEVVPVSSEDESQGSVEVDLDAGGDDAILGSDIELESDIEAPPEEQMEPSLETESGSATAQKKKRRKLKHLPMFASADDYAHLLADDDDDNI